MRKSRYSEYQKMWSLHAATSGLSVKKICHKVGMSDTTFYNWKKRYAHLNESEVQRLVQKAALSKSDEKS